MDNRLEICAVGDILLYGRYDQLAADADPASVFAAVTSLFAESDLVVGNLECPLTEQGEARSDKLCLRGSPQWAAVLRNAGIDVVSLANNHSFDFGTAGCFDTARQLELAGIAALGIGSTLSEARRPVTIERNGIRLGFLAYCHESTNGYALAGEQESGVAPLIQDHVLEDIAMLRPTVDHVVLLLHWGIEYSPYPTPDQIALAHAAIDRGASLILGAHSHMLQGIEQYGGGLVAYSLANFTDSDVDWSQAGKTYHYRMRDVDRESIALRVVLTRSEVRLRDVVPLWLDDDGKPCPADPDRADRVRQDLEQRSEALSRTDMTRHWEQDLVDRRVMAPFIYWWKNGSILDKIRKFNLGQLKTLYLLAETFVRIKFSRGESKWSLFSSRNDKRPTPYAGSGDGDADGPGA